ncbi:oxidoreductase [Microtetraspora sp. NBRC 13810]|uniref:FAD-dependent oxidoreductase n=1 Tax=Microtetraspora sp. NBRC 13810 TaxID=3030990 RepID=UPI00249FD0B4|nr:FAD-dependent oxidoreductase [Microtetraspora sp. NBRC 13810]GLW06643.1 oxidoreductase [Microtetraspora sp. NBRC 13810]
MRTTCVIAGSGPAGAMLALLLGRAGVDVTLLEKHGDFLRDFRGDTIHPSTLQVIDELGLSAEFHRMPHHQMSYMSVSDGRAMRPVADLRRLPGKYRYIAFVPQWDFLDLIVGHARRNPNLRVLMNAEVTGVITEKGAVRGVHYRDAAGDHEIRAALTVAADGRGSVVRRAAGLRPKDFGAPMDVVWFRLPRTADDVTEPFLRFDAGAGMVAINREAYWQLAYLIPKGGFAALRARGIAEFREDIGEMIPFLADRARNLASFDDTSVLSVVVDRLPRWYLPGLLCIGDAAHAMSPIAGVGINLAVQDAVAAANLLAGPMVRAERSRRPVLDPMPASLLARVQRRRLPPAAITQALQLRVQNQTIGPMLAGRRPRMPRVVSPVRRHLAGRLIGLGIRPEHVRPEFRSERSSQ